MILDIIRFPRPKTEIVVFYASPSLRAQLARWRRRHPRQTIAFCSAKATAGIRRALRGAKIALVDATAHSQAAVAAFGQAADCLGGYAAAVYVERTQPWLELFVRTRGAQLLLGPHDGGQWQGFFEQALLWANGSRARNRFALCWMSASPHIADGGAYRRASARQSFFGPRRPKLGTG
jgi:hypothetical protein